MASNVVVSGKGDYRKTLKEKVDRRGTQTMGIIVLYVVTSIFDILYNLIHNSG